MGFAKVDVEVGHRHPFGVEETLEQEVERDRVEVGDGQRPGGDRARARSTARADGDVVRLGPFDEVGDDQEIARKAHSADHAEFEIEPFTVAGEVFGRAAGEPQVEAQMRVAAELLVLVVGQPRQDRTALGRGDGAALGDDLGVGKRFGQVGEQRFHRGGGLKPGFGVRGGAVGVVDLARRGDAQQCVVGGVEAGVRVGDGIGRDQRQVERIGELDQPVLGGDLDGIAAAREFDVEPAREQGRQAFEQGPSSVRRTFCDQAGGGPLPAGGQCDQAGIEVGERRELDMGLIAVGAVHVRGRDQSAEVEIALLVLGEKDEPVEPASGQVGGTGDADGRADDRLNALGRAIVGEAHRRVEPVAVGQGDGREAERVGALGDVRGLHRAFEHRETGKYAQGDEDHRPVIETPGARGSARADLSPVRVA